MSKLRNHLLLSGIISVLPIIISFSFVQAQNLPGTYSTSWVGNTIVPTASNGRGIVQGWANSMFVDGDGTI